MNYCVSVALLDRTVGFPQFDDARVRRDDVQALMPKVRMVVHPDQTTRACLPTKFTEVTMTLKDGRTLSRRVSLAKGQPRNALTDAELRTKFRDCAARALPTERVEALLTAIEKLDTAPSVQALASLLGAEAA